MTEQEARDIAARALASGAIKVGAHAPVCVRSVVKHDDPTAARVLARHGKLVRAVAKAHGLDVSAVAGRSAQYAALNARRECWRKLVAGGSSVASVAEVWGVAYRTVSVAMK